MTIRIIFAFLLLFSFTKGYSGSVKDLIKKAGTSANYPGSNALIVFDSTDVEIMETGLSYVNRHQVYKILTKVGAKELNVIKFDYDPFSAFVEIQKVNIYRVDGSIEEVDVSGVKDYPAPARMIYWGARQILIEIGRLEPGDAIEVFMFRKGFTYALLQGEDDKYIPPMRGHYYDIVEFWHKYPVKEKVYHVDIPSDKYVQYKFYNGSVDSVIVKNDSLQQYTFTKKEILPVKRKPQMVANSDITAKLLISTSPDWQTKSKWFYGVNEDYGSFETTPEIDLKVAEILKSAKNEDDSISLLTHWCADEIRYSGISMGEGEGFTLHTGDMTFTDRCGVCKDKAGILITMLRAAGFESYAAMTMAGSRIDSIPADQFNHCVTIVKKSDEKYHLLDPTWVPWVRELWSSAEQQQNYLPGPPEGSDIMITDISPPENHYFKISGKSELKADGTLIGEIVLTAEGQSDASVRRTFVRSNKADWDEIVERNIRHNAANIEISNIQYGDPYDYTNPIRVSFSYTIPGYALVTDSEIIFTPFVATNLFGNYQSHLNAKTDIEERKEQFKDRCSRLLELDETITLPPYKEVVFLPDSLQSEGSGADFEGHYTINSKKLILFEKGVFKKRIYDAEDWPSYSEAVKNQNAFAEKYIILKTK